MSHDELHVLAEEQAALRRVATLVARGVPPEEVFAAVTGEVGRLLSAKYASLGRYESDGTVTVVAGSGSGGDQIPAGRRWELGGKNINTLVFETGRPARIDDYADASGPLGIAAREDGVVSGMGTPVTVEGRLWGVMGAYGAQEQPLPADTDARLVAFTELVATAISIADARAEVTRLAEEQEALRRTATLVAQGVPAGELFRVVTEEAGTLLGADLASMGRLEADDMLTVVATWPGGGGPLEVGVRWPREASNLGARVWRTGRPARVDGQQGVPAPLAAFREELGIRSSVASPIVVEGVVWGGLVVHSKQAEPLPAETESRLARFTELVATAIANAQGRAELIASRARVVTAADEMRRRIERDLHDGIQQRLVSLQLELRGAQGRVPPQLGGLEGTLSGVAEGLAGALEELQEISRGIHPAILSSGGLEPALATLRRRSAVPVELDLRTGRRLPAQVEVAAYYVVSEALTNAAKHARASVVKVELDSDDGMMHLAIRDDGIGGADLSPGSGLVGLRDRIEALGGTLRLASPAGSGTTLLIEVPLEDESAG